MGEERRMEITVVRKSRMLIRSRTSKFKEYEFRSKGRKDSLDEEDENGRAPRHGASKYS